MQAAPLPDRGIVKIAGDDAHKLLNGLLTVDVEKIVPGRPRFTALLTPQGKILFDGILVAVPEADGGGFLFDCPRALAGTAVERLTFYKLRAKARIENLSDALQVVAVWGGPSPSPVEGLVYPDPRLADLGFRIVVAAAHDVATELGAKLVDAAQYERHRIALGIPRGGMDFAYGDTFPHEADMEQLNGVDFDKGCYIGQEIVSRMEHRGTARTRIVSVSCEKGAPEPGASIMAGDRVVGTMGSAADGRGIALVRLDRAESAGNAGATLTAGGLPITIAKPQWARFSVPGHTMAAE
ncbi:MAG: folate-binding protein YgfZ [Pseudorhodoplanes sp.]